MLNVKIDPEMYMKTKGRMTRLPIIIRAFVPGLRHFCENRREFIGLLGRKCTDFAAIGTKPGPRSAHPFFGPSNPSAGDGVVLRWRDEPMVR
jgi:hypothetical protein